MQMHTRTRIFQAHTLHVPVNIRPLLKMIIYTHMHIPLGSVGFCQHIALSNAMSHLMKLLRQLVRAAHPLIASKNTVNNNELVYFSLAIRVDEAWLFTNNSSKGH